MSLTLYKNCDPVGLPFFPGSGVQPEIEKKVSAFRGPPSGNSTKIAEKLEKLAKNWTLGPFSYFSVFCSNFSGEGLGGRSLFCSRPTGSQYKEEKNAMGPSWGMWAIDQDTW